MFIVAWLLGAVSGWSRGLQSGKTEGKAELNWEIKDRTGISVSQLYKAHDELQRTLQTRKVNHASP